MRQHQPRLVLLGAIAHEARPIRGTRNELLECREHLAAVAHAQGERRVALEEGPELVARKGIEQDRFRPAFAGAEHIAIGEAAASDEAVEPPEPRAPLEDVGHVHIVGIESRA